MRESGIREADIKGINTKENPVWLLFGWSGRYQFYWPQPDWPNLDKVKQSAQSVVDAASLRHAETTAWKGEYRFKCPCLATCGLVVCLLQSAVLLSKSAPSCPSRCFEPCRLMLQLRTER